VPGARAMIGIVVNGLNPELLLITGGVAGALAPLEGRVLRAAGGFAFSRPLRGRGSGWSPATSA